MAVAVVGATLLCIILVNMSTGVLWATECPTAIVPPSCTVLNIVGVIISRHVRFFAWNMQLIA